MRGGYAAYTLRALVLGCGLALAAPMLWAQALPTPTRVGMPNSRATEAMWPLGLPTSVMMPTTLPMAAT